MAIIKAIAKKDCLPYFKMGDKITIIPILYEKDTCIVNEIYGLYKGENFVKIFEMTDIHGSGKGVEIKKIAEKQYAPKGSYKDSVIKVNRKTYPSSIVICYQDYFEKV